MNIRTYTDADLEVLRQITAICFDGVSIDQNIEQLFGRIAGCDWKWRKMRHIDADADANGEGIFVAEIEGQVVGYITTRIDHEAGVGGIPNYAVLPDHQKQGIGLALARRAISYLKEEGMECIRVETLEQNPVGTRFYPKLGFKEVARQIHYAMPIQEKGR